MPFVIIVIICGVGLLCGWIYKKYKKYKKDHIPKPKIKKQKKQKQTAEIKNIPLTVITPFMERKEVLFWKYLHMILPKGMVAVPKVGLNTLVIPDGDRNIFNLVSDKALDFVIFSEDDMSVLLVIDIYDNSLSDRSLKEQDPYLANILSKLKIKVLQVLVSYDFDKIQTKKDIFKALDIKED